MIKHILIAEDDARDTEALCLALQAAGINNPITIVQDGEEAVAYLNADYPFTDREKFPLPSVLLLDLRMPRLDGLDVLEWMARQTHLSRMLVVSVSGNTNAPEVTRSYILGSHVFLAKPILPEDITNLVRSFPGFWASLEVPSSASVVAQFARG